MVWRFSQVRIIEGQFVPREPKLEMSDRDQMSSTFTEFHAGFDVFAMEVFASKMLCLIADLLRRSQHFLATLPGQYELVEFIEVKVFVICIGF